MNMRRVAVGLIFCVLAVAQEDDLAGFTRNPQEHEITVLQQSLQVRAVTGVVRRKQGDGGPLPGVVFEVRGPGDEKTIRRAITDRNGRFDIKGLRAGKYQFKSTLDGFQSVVGVIILSKENPNKRIEIQMLVGV